MKRISFFMRKRPVEKLEKMWFARTQKEVLSWIVLIGLSWVGPDACCSVYSAADLRL